MYAYRVRTPFTLNGVDYERGDLLTGSDAAQLELHPALLLRCVRVLARAS